MWRRISTRSWMQSCERLAIGMEDRTDGAVTPGDVGGAEKARIGQCGKSHRFW
jgi:hypothetical protein